MSPAAALPEDEKARMARLRALEILDTEPEAMFDVLTQMAAGLAGTPIALISLVDRDRQWFKSNTGLEGTTETPRELAFCTHAILGTDLMEVPDAQADARFAANPLVTADPAFRFYAGAPIILSDGARLGTLCVIDRRPRKLSALQRDLLMRLAAAAAGAIEARESTKLAERGQRRLADELAQTHRRNAVLLATIEACPIAISIADMTQPHAPIVYANPMVTQLTGFALGEVVGQVYPYHDSSNFDPATAARLRAAVANGQQTEIEHLQRRKDGTAFLARLTLAPTRDPAGRVNACIGLQRDITAEAQRRDALAAQREKLAAIGRSMGGVAHEINNMLQPVALLAQDMLDQRMVNAGGREHLGIILDCARKARHIIGDLLAFSRPAAAAARPLDVTRLLRQNLMLASQSVPRNVTLSTDIAAGPLWILIEGTKFAQILLNLVTNAVAAMGGSGALGIVLDALEPQTGSLGRRQARLRVSDTGCGMDATTLDRAFEPFFTTKAIGQGTGLGLPMVYGMVREAGGTIRLESTPGHGTQVEILIPCVMEQADDGEYIDR